MAGLEKTHDVRKLAEIPRFVSINSTIEIDLHGQCNGETVKGVQFSGVGGSLDYSFGVKNLTNDYQNNFDTGKNRDSNFVYGPSAPRTFFFSLVFKTF